LKYVYLLPNSKYEWLNKLVEASTTTGAALPEEDVFGRWVRSPFHTNILFYHFSDKMAIPLNAIFEWCPGFSCSAGFQPALSRQNGGATFELDSTYLWVVSHDHKFLVAALIERRFSKLT
jgi:hypothetical protein